MDTKTDLRVIKTRRAIKSAFLQLIQKKSLDKITVTELAKAAEINKGTFYLHYSDVYALYYELLQEQVEKIAAHSTYYEQMLNNPEAFVRGFFIRTSDTLPDAGAVLFSPQNIRFCENVFSMIVDAIIENIFNAGIIERTELNIMKLQFLIDGMFLQFSRCAAKMDNEPVQIEEEMVQYLASQIRYSFSS
ncbi:TetR/AcrR family transcriptional regulator [Hespellia stercorisuis]|uniref:Transcriptional regulator, TetR family n=1 Tax=Hespellia stercorisuis DSM 15480 TaxID=1121950 RepID=A0A1M6T4V0_9FIRM|nr:TetR/AcrR family transcriptional regulator [Hespellia stercorisuis]SHK52003.1 transcriptional regulator, TetR family [Hespellia stercorisuis DSM 15480]